jgi:hypothetical protein
MTRRDADLTYFMDMEDASRFYRNFQYNAMKMYVKCTLEKHVIKLEFDCNDINISLISKMHLLL